MTLADIDIAVLCGGSGSRISSALGDNPKVLADINGKPFLEWLITSLRVYEPHRVVLCAGYRAEKLREWCANRVYDGIEIVLSVEDRQKGTGAALRLARRVLTSDPVMIINGDTLTNADLGSFVEYHGMGSLSVLYGRQFSNASAWQSAGYYLMSQETLDHLAKGDWNSLETFIEKWPTKRSLRSGIYYDIGTVNALRMAGEFIEMMEPPA